MLDETNDNGLQARIAEVESRRVPLAEVARWFAPWVLAGGLMIVFLGGLWFASAAADPGTYAVGLAAAALALGALIWELVTALAGKLGSGKADRFLVEDETSLVVLVALLVALALGGLVLAARSAEVAASGAGYGLFFFAIVLICVNLKHYFDRRERS